MHAWEVLAHGRVQGVGFRHFAKTCARRCGIAGYVKNLYDGSVLIVARGRVDDLRLFCDMLRAGNGYSRVSRLDVTELAETESYDDFEIR